MTTTAVKATAKGVGAVGKATYRGARAVVTSGEEDVDGSEYEAERQAEVRDDEPMPINPHLR